MSEDPTYSSVDSEEVLWYNYVPTELADFDGIFLCGVSPLTTISSIAVHAVQATRFRLWWLFPTAVICGVTETIGWSGRLWSSQRPYLRLPFLMQISTTIMAPTFLIAANFIILGWITRQLGPQFCRLSPIQYSAFFLSCDTIALIIQAVGGGLASGIQPVLGAHIALGGIAIQLLVLTLYAALSAEFIIRFTMDKPMRRDREPEKGVILLRGMAGKPTVCMLISLSTMLMLLFFRSIYRMIELSGGWSGTVISTQWLFDVFDGAMVVLAMFTLNLFHPGVLLREPDKNKADFGKMEGYENQGSES